MQLNRAGNASFHCYDKDDYSSMIRNRITSIVAYRNNAPKWSGMVVGTDYTASTGLIEVKVTGWLDMLRNRYFRPTYQKLTGTAAITQGSPTIVGTGTYFTGDLEVGDSITVGLASFTVLTINSNTSVTATSAAISTTSGLAVTKVSRGGAVTYTNVDDGLLIHNILDKANEQTGAMVGAASSTFITKGTRETGVVRTPPKYEAWQEFGACIETLTDIENGRDIIIDPITRKLNVYGKIGEVKSNLVFGYEAGPRNLRDFKLLEDSTRQWNREVVIGKDSVGAGFAENRGNMALNGIVEHIDSIPEVANTQVLSAFANAELAFHLRHSVYEIMPKPWSKNSDNDVPQPFEDYNIGDTGYFSVNTVRETIDTQAIRIFGFTVSIDDDGTETIDKITTNLAA